MASWVCSNTQCNNKGADVFKRRTPRTFVNKSGKCPLCGSQGVQWVRAVKEGEETDVLDELEEVKE